MRISQQSYGPNLTAFLKKHDLVYIGTGAWIFPITCRCLCLLPDEIKADESSIIEDAYVLSKGYSISLHYFVPKSVAKDKRIPKWFPVLLDMKDLEDKTHPYEFKMKKTKKPKTKIKLSEVAKTIRKPLLPPNKRHKLKAEKRLKKDWKKLPLDGD